jgi:hypothetical protein
VKQQLLEAAVLRTDTVPINGQKVTVREASTEAFSRYSELSKTDRVRAMASLIAHCVVDEAGVEMLTEEEAIPLAKLARTATPLMSKLMTLSGLKMEDEKEGDQPEKHPNAG